MLCYTEKATKALAGPGIAKNDNNGSSKTVVSYVLPTCLAW